MQAHKDLSVVAPLGAVKTKNIIIGGLAAIRYAAHQPVMKLITLLAVTTILVSTSAPAQDQWLISISGGILAPNFFAHNSSGQQIEATVFYELSDSLRLTLSSGYAWWKEGLGPGGATFSAVPLLVGLRLLFPTGRISPYLSGEIGAQFIKRKYILEMYDQGGIHGLDRLISSAPASESATRLAFRFGAGITIAVSDPVNLDLSLRYGRISYYYVYQYPIGWHKGSVELPSIQVGLGYAL